MRIPGLGEVVEDVESEWYVSAPMPVAVLGGVECRFVVDGYDDDARQGDFHAAIRAFLALDESALQAAAPHVYAYYRDVADADIEIQGPEQVFDHVRLGTEPTVSRDSQGSQRVCVSIESECAWEPEHGLQIVFRDGVKVTKVGPYDGHLSNPSAYVYHNSGESTIR
ncbi:DUF6985 domain-containing protein [Asanoa iriomotensis]|uniref:DUF6985 domain-containing protein n=1 Tax=Asanoa iriomotensis TaxID=234613 RepID=A0ABQ4C182_9ACTN|nr:hypothetical protein [Asanoa iriomotensis]GIF56540.1 hypothetical protein Air01nite_26350 [Asanoa iriomotensis]